MALLIVLLFFFALFLASAASPIQWNRRGRHSSEIIAFLGAYPDTATTQNHVSRRGIRAQGCSSYAGSGCVPPSPSKFKLDFSNTKHL